MPESFPEFMETHSSRLMLPFFMISQLICVKPIHINAKSIRQMRELGSLLSWKGMKVLLSY